MESLQLSPAAEVDKQTPRRAHMRQRRDSLSATLTVLNACFLRTCVLLDVFCSQSN